MKLEVHSSCEPIAPEWETLAVESRVSPFLRPGWIAAWWRTFGHGQLEILTTRRGGRLTGVLPVVRRGATAASPTNWHTPEFGAVTARESDTTDLLEGLLAPGPRRVRVGLLDAASPLSGALAEAHGYSHARRVLQRPPYVEVGSDWETFMAGRSRNLRQSLSRTRRRLEELGELSFELHQGPEGLERLLQEGFELEAKGWKGEGGTAILSRPQTADFYREVSAWASRRGLLRLASLRLDRRLIAFELSLQDERSYYLLKPAYEPELGRLNPGKVLTGETVRHAFEEGLETYEFLGAGDPYKLKWAERCRERIEVQLFAPSAAGKVDRLLQTRGRELARRTLRTLRRSSA